MFSIFTISVQLLLCSYYGLSVLFLKECEQLSKKLFTMFCWFGGRFCNLCVVFVKTDNSYKNWASNQTNTLKSK